MMLMNAKHKKLTFLSIDKVLILCLIFLLLSVESSLQTSIIWDRSAAWTLWLYKVGHFSIADIIILAITIITIFRILAKSSISASPYLLLCLLALVYLYIGFIYNIGVFTFWKTYLYDFKVVLYLSIPYLFLYSIKEKEGIIKWFTPKRIFIYAAIATLIDLAIVNIWGRVEYPSYFGLPVIPALLPISVSMVGILYARKLTHKMFFLILLLMETINAINRLSLGFLFAGVIAILYINVLRLNVSHSVRFGLVLSVLLFVNILSITLITNPFNIDLLSAKSGGAITRQIQWENVLLNFDKNIPGVIGKGLGSTWFEYVPIPETDIYSVGTSVGSTSEEAMSMPVKFVFNFGPAALLYKWGILGGIMLCFFIAIYFQWHAKKIKRLQRLGLNKREVHYLYAVLIISTIYILENFTYIGLLKTSLITSLLAFYTTYKIQTKLTEMQNKLQYGK